MKAQIDKLDEYIVKKGHLFGCKLVDDAKFFCQTNSALCSPYLLTHTHTHSRDFATNSAKHINSLLSKLSNWSFCCCQLSFPCRMDETHLRPPIHLQLFFFFDQQQNLWVFSAELIHILPDCSRLQTPSGGYSCKLKNDNITKRLLPAHLFNFSCRAQHVREIDLGGKSRVRNNPVQSAVHLSRRCSIVVTLRLCLMESNVMALMF